MSVFIASIILILIASAYAALLKRKLAETVFLSATTIVGVLYCFGLANIQGCLLYGVYTMVLFALVCLTYLIYKWRKNKNIFFETEVLPGILLYLILLSFSLIINVGMVFHNWDEFSHWGIVVKYFYSVDAFATFRNSSLSGISFPQYFPGISLFQYFFSRFESGFIEYYSYIAKNILYFSLFMPLIGNLFTKTKWIKNVFFLLIFLLIPLQKEIFYSSLYVDEILGAFFGFILIYYFVYKYEKTKYGILMVTASAFMTTITKDIGLLLSLGCIAVITLDALLYRRAQIKSFILNKSLSAYKVAAIFLLSLPLVMVLFVKLTWALLLLSSGMRAGGFWKQPSLHDVLNLALKQVELYQKETAVNLVSAVFHRNIAPLHVSIFWFCGIFLLIVVILALYYRKQIAFRRIVSSAFVIAAGAGIYQIVLMIMYVFSFSPYEAVRLASYERYTFTYILGMIYFIMIFFFIDNGIHTQIDIRQILNNLKAGYKKIMVKLTSDGAVMYKDVLVGMKMLFSKLCSIMIFIIMFFIINTKLSGLINTEAIRIIYLLGMTYFIIIFFFINNDKYTPIDVKYKFDNLKTCYKNIINKFTSNGFVLYKNIIMIGKFGIKLLFFVFCSIMILKLCVFSNTGITYITEGRTYSYQFTRTTAAINKWKPYLEGKKTYIICQGDNGAILGPLYYELNPNYSLANKGYDYSIRPERPPESTIEDDMYNLTVTPDEWQKYVMSKGFDLIYVFRSDDTFVSAYSQFFPDGVADDTLYNVTFENGVMLLLPVQIIYENSILRDPYAYWSCDDELPEIPDNPAGTRYRNDTAWTGWVGENITVKNGIIQSIAPYGFPGSALHIGRTMTLTNNEIILIRARKTAGGRNELRIDLRSDASVSLFMGILDSEWRVYASHLPEGENLWYGNVYVGGSPDDYTLELSDIYVGDASYFLPLILIDNSGNSRHAAISGMVTTQGKFRGGLLAAGGFAKASGVLNGHTGDFTVSAWADKATHVFGKRGDSSSMGFGISSGRGYFISDNPFAEIFVGQFKEDGRMHHLLLMVKNKIMYFYVDGRLNGKANISKYYNGPLGKDDFFIGAVSSSRIGARNTTIDEVAIFDKALTDQEIQALYMTTLEKKFTGAITQ